MEASGGRRHGGDFFEQAEARGCGQPCGREKASRQDRAASSGTGFFAGFLCAVGRAQKWQMIDMKWPRLSALRECTLLQLNRSGIYDRSVPENRKYPYLLRDLVIDWPNQVWCSDITYIPMRKGFLYLVAIMAGRPARCCRGDCRTRIKARSSRRHGSRTCWTRARYASAWADGSASLELLIKESRQSRSCQ